VLTAFPVFPARYSITRNTGISKQGQSGWLVVLDSGWRRVFMFRVDRG